MGSIKIYIMINIGDLSNGGIVFYVDASGEHGLVASTKNQSNAAPWGCLGGLKCGFDNECVYDGKDDVRAVYEERLKKADILEFAQATKVRLLSARFKRFINRRF